MNRRPHHSIENLTTSIAAACVRRNQIASDQLATLISTARQALSRLRKPVAETESERSPAVPIRRDPNGHLLELITRPYGLIPEGG